MNKLMRKALTQLGGTGGKESTSSKTVGRLSFRHLAASCMLWFAAVGICLFPSIDSAAAGTLQRPLEAAAAGSLPSRLLPDGTVCILDEGKPSTRAKRLFKIPRKILKAHSITFYGLFDLDGDGVPEVFLDYWSPFGKHDGDKVVLLVYKEVHGKYRQHLRLKAQSFGYAPGAWFLKEEPHPKAIFMTRYAGSSGAGLFYLNAKTKSLDLISDGVFIEGRPEFEDLDGDGMAEIYLPGRGRDRTGQSGAAILHWNGEGYGAWWPDWPSKPYVIYAKLVDLDKDGRKEIVAILDPSDGEKNEGESAKRELGVWKIEDGKPILSTKAEIPKSKFPGEPFFDWVSPSREKPDIGLSYTRTLGCTYVEGKMVCRDAKDFELPAVENRGQP